MTPLLLALVLSQTPPPLSEAVPPGAEPPEVKLFAEFVDRHLLAIGASGSSMEVRQRERVFRLQDEDFETAFKLVPDAFVIAQQAHSDYLIASRLNVAALVVVGVALAVTVVATLVRVVLLPLLVASLVASGVGLVISLIALPFALSAQSKFFSSVASYNRGLLDLRPPQNPALGGGLTLALPE